MPYDLKSSLPAYQENKEGKDFCRQIVFTTIRKLGPCNDRQVAEFLNWPINRVTPRRGELVEAGLIIQDRKDKDPLSNRLVSFWRIKPVGLKQLPLFQ